MNGNGEVGLNGDRLSNQITQCICFDVYGSIIHRYAYGSGNGNTDNNSNNQNKNSQTNDITNADFTKETNMSAAKVNRDATDNISKNNDNDNGTQSSYAATGNDVSTSEVSMPYY